MRCAARPLQQAAIRYAYSTPSLTLQQLTQIHQHTESKNQWHTLHHTCKSDQSLPPSQSTTCYPACTSLPQHPYSQNHWDQYISNLSQFPALNVIQAARFSTAQRQPFYVGQILRHGKTFTQKDVDTFQQLTGDLNPIHNDAVAAKAAGFDAPLVPGILLASLIPAVATKQLENLIYATQNLRFKAPLYVGQHVIVHVEVTSVMSGKVRVDTKAFRAQDKQDVLEGKALFLVQQGGDKEQGQE